MSATTVTESQLKYPSHVWHEVGDIMTRNVVTLSEEASAAEAAGLMCRQGISCIVVLNGDEISGILTERDFVQNLKREPRDLAKRSICEVMSRAFAVLPTSCSVLEASRIADERQIKHLCVMESGRLSGIVTQTDLVRVLTSYGLSDTVEAIMTTGMTTIESSARVADAVSLMAQRGISCIIAQENNQPVGIFTERDLVRKVLAANLNEEEVRISQVMTTAMVSVTSDCPIFRASLLLEKNRIRRLPVIDGTMLRGIVTQTDILKAIEGKLRREEEKQFAILENSSTCIFHADTDGVITYTNPALLRRLEIEDASILIGTKFLPKEYWVNRKDYQAFESHRKQADIIENYELSLQSTRGKRIYLILFTSQIRNSRGQFHGYQGMLYDNTDRRESEHILRQAEQSAQLLAQEAIEASEAKNQFLANMSHEMRTPLNSIMGFSELLLNEPVDDQQSGYLHIVLKNAEHLLRLIDDILDFSKIEAGKLATEITDTSLDELLDHLDAVFRPQALEKSLRLVFHRGPNLPSTLHTDSGRLCQCLANLIKNAIKFTEQGTVEVSVNVLEYESRLFVRFDVKDTGIGIAVEEQKYIFEAFAQANRESAMKFGGTGLGLAITRKLIRLLGGEVVFESCVEKGSVFSLILPTHLDGVQDTCELARQLSDGTAVTSCS